MRISSGRKAYKGRARCQAVTNPILRVRLRFEWDWKGVERELRRANELKTDYPAAHQWYRAYRVSKRIYEEVHISKRRTSESELDVKLAELRESLPTSHPFTGIDV